MQYAIGYVFDASYSDVYSQVMDIAQRLDQAMKDAGIKTESALSRVSGVPQPTINRILKGGGKKGPETTTVKKLAVACGVSFQWLVEGVGHKYKTTAGQEKNQVEDVDIDGDQLIEMIFLFRQSTAEARKRIVLYARQAEKLPASLRTALPTNDT